MLIDTYLRTHFIEKDVFAAQAGIAVARLDELIAAQAIPAPSYTCNGVAIHSAVFGDIAITEPVHGAFFRPQCVRWGVLADQAAPGQERVAVLAQLEDELAQALQPYCSTPEAVQARVQAYLPYFFNGTFGLCVADPSRGAGIVRKEMLQEQLIEVTANGSELHPAGYPPAQLLQLIDDYAAAAMPFSPAEYARSSRKRLVDDLRPRVEGA
ncbi:MAG: hypothetical protein GAK31_00130 [Stenotrophomonas maltophilia]|uniref:Uncharacterized protein n=1 Tax=Stenotrophomonas maltophilia TaxID=40324 RepID=A0A7V8JN08_STEMA|nr:MAG: hypothetical protein GAK31_00130 [Stenotrophomonas maltophilia]